MLNMSVQSADKDQSLSEYVVLGVAEREGVAPTDLRPLYEVIDPEMLDVFVTAAGSRNSDAEVSFTYHGYRVTVTPSEEVDFGPLDIDQA